LLWKWGCKNSGLLQGIAKEMGKKRRLRLAFCLLLALDEYFRIYLASVGKKKRSSIPNSSKDSLV